MDNFTKDLLSSTFSETMDKMAFIFSDPVSKDEVEIGDQRYLSAVISFSGKYRGAIEITAPEETCCIIAANMLGREPEEEDCAKKAIDAFKEALNIFCGQFLTNAYGEEEAFLLSTPVGFIYSEEKVKRIAQNENSICFSVEDQPFIIQAMVAEPEKEVKVAE